MRVFISYRRDDSMVTAALLYRELASRSEFADAFMDIDDIGYGADFVAAIDAALRDADVVVVVIGPRWIEMLQARLRGDDWVRHEVATALGQRGEGARSGRAALRVLPVLIGDAAPPADSALPADLAPLARLGMLKFDERALKASINSLLEAVQEEGFEGKVRRLQDERRRLEEEHQVLEGERQHWSRARIASVGAAFALFLAAMLGVFDFFGLGPRVAGATMLLAHVAAPESPWSGEVVLVGIDEASERAIGRKFDPSWRAEHAKLIANAASAAARTVAFDIVLEDHGTDDANAALRGALAATRDKMAVVFGVATRGDDGSGAMLAQFASLARRGVICAGVALGQARSMVLAVRHAAPAASAASAAAAGAAQSTVGLLPSLALAAFSGGGRIDLIEELPQTVVVRLRKLQSTEKVGYYEGKTLVDPQPGCEIVQPGDRVVTQLLDPYTLPPLRSAPQRVAYERLVTGDPAALALLKDRIILVGTQFAGADRMPLPWPADDRWGVELMAAQIDAMTRGVAIRPIHPIAEWALVSAAALLGAFSSRRLRTRSRALRLAVLLTIALLWIAASIAWYRGVHQIVAVPYDLAALALGAWFANRNRRRTTT
jgi:CHASE2 domain-containing sensor protein